MKTYPLVPSQERVARRGNFFAVVQPDGLQVPLEVYRVANKLSIKNAIELVSYLSSFPAAFAADFGWATSDVAMARDRLTKQLKGVLPPAMFESHEPVQRSFGAFPPSWDQIPDP